MEPLTKNRLDALGIEAGRSGMAPWTKAAAESGRVYYDIRESKSGMSAVVKLWIVRDGMIDQAWPRLDFSMLSGLSQDEISVAHEALRKTIGFDFARRGFKLNGSGFNRAYEALSIILRFVGDTDEISRRIRLIPIG